MYTPARSKLALGLAIVSQQIPHPFRPELCGQALIDYLAQEMIEPRIDLVQDGYDPERHVNFEEGSIPEYFNHYRHAEGIMTTIDGIIAEANLKEGKGRKGGCIIAGGSVCDLVTGKFLLGEQHHPLTDCDFFLYGLPVIPGQEDGDANGDVVHPLIQTIIEALCAYAHRLHDTDCIISYSDSIP
jgi:hypothetical protein